VVKPALDPGVRRTIATVAWLYHTRGLRQSGIAERLHISQSRVSRLLDQAVELGIVHTTVVLPADEQSILEQELANAYDLTEVHVHDLGEVGEESELVRELGQLLALHLQCAPLNAGVIGFTSWSRTLAETVRNLQPLRQADVHYIVEMVGDLGPPTLQHLAAQNTQRLANLTGAEPVFLRLPGVLPDRELKQTLLDHDSHVRAALTKLDELDFAMTGIGAVGIVPPLQAGDNFFTTEQVARAKKLGAVGELNLRFIARTANRWTWRSRTWSSERRSNNSAAPIADWASPVASQNTARSGRPWWVGGSTCSLRTREPLSGSSRIDIDRPIASPEVDGQTTGALAPEPGRFQNRGQVCGPTVDACDWSCV